MAARSKKDETNPKVMELVEKELEKNPDASVDELWDKARKIDPSVAKLTKRQFHARYPLQIKRRKSRGSKKKTTSRKKRASGKPAAKKATGKRASRKESSPAAPTANREAVRTVFLAFASDLAAAEARKDVVKVLAGVDTYVNRAMKAAGA